MVVKLISPQYFIWGGKNFTLSTVHSPRTTDNPATLISDVLKFRFKTQSYNATAVDSQLWTVDKIVPCTHRGGQASTKYGY